MNPGAPGSDCHLVSILHYAAALLTWTHGVVILRQLPSAPHVDREGFYCNLAPRRDPTSLIA